MRPVSGQECNAQDVKDQILREGACGVGACYNGRGKEAADGKSDDLRTYATPSASSERALMKHGTPNPRKQLLAHLETLLTALSEVSFPSLEARGGWDRALFDAVLARVEALTPAFQAALVAYLAEGKASAAEIEAVLAVDRLSAAYTYWTRLFPPRQDDEAMFVLSLLHDLGARVEQALDTLERAR